MESVFRYETKVDVLGNLAGIITTPKGFDPAKEKLPVIVNLHGAGERGDGSPEQLKRILIQQGLAYYFWNDPDYKGLRVITVSPQCPQDMFWTHLTFPLMQWIESAVALVNGDRNRISVTGLSMGGYATWDLMCTFPDYFSCGAPVCGGGIPGLAFNLKGQKIWAFHSIDDSIVSYKYSLDMVTAARRNGASINFTTYDKYDHGSWTPAYRDTNLIEWLVEQSK
ncbi:MAG: phospholipase [Clostridia bacterium]|nr:phospholipase [Clostridia bacterium]